MNNKCTVTVAFELPTGPVYITGSGETQDLAYKAVYDKFYARFGEEEEVDHSYVVDTTE